MVLSHKDLYHLIEIKSKDTVYVNYIVLFEGNNK